MRRIPFTPDDESAIGMLSGSMMFLLVINLLFGGLGLLGGCCSFFGIPGRAVIHPMLGVAAAINGVGVSLFCAGMVAQGALLFQIYKALTAVVATDDQDQALFSDVFKKLKFYFMLEAALFLVSMLVQCGAFLTQIFGPVGQIMGAGL
ncbi:MAG: hypothetical protein AB8I08_21640 [Sandaracinaceae bacterium]